MILIYIFIIVYSLFYMDIVAPYNFFFILDIFFFKFVLLNELFVIEIISYDSMRDKSLY